MNIHGIDNPPTELPKSSSFQKDDRWQLVLRVAASRDFCKSARLRQFLLYVSEKALTNSIEDTHEQKIGLEVFGRRDGYNPAEDNIVRVEARELRRRLDRYFDTEGATEPIRIRIPKGGYAPVFEARGKPVQPKPDQTNLDEYSDSELASSPAKIESAAGWKKPITQGIPWATVSWVLTIAILSFCFGLAVEVVRSGRPSHSTTASESDGPAKAESATPGSFWPSLFDPQHPLIIVVSDAALVLAQSLARQRVPLEDYSNGSYSAKLGNLRSEFEMIASRPYTSVTDAVLAAKLAQAAATHHRAAVVRFARNLKMWDFNNENFIFLGSAYSDPWVQQFDQERNFTVSVDEATRRLYFLNKSPQTGEPERYYAAGQDNRSNENYGLVTYLPNSGRASKVMILDGTNSVATEAAGDFITDPYYGAQFAQYVKFPVDSSHPPYFQLVLKVTSFNDTPSEVQVIAHRVGPKL